MKMRDRTRHLRCHWLPPRLFLALLELDPRFFNNVRATSCHEMASMNAWRDSDEILRYFIRNSLSLTATVAHGMSVDEY
ncbi:hypothetical protein E2C01_039502 [Portunus trituberculatus]|uniref:Uncharacterized protein n=1 Tax=Portunus trituberculatus TaxID=210409 RepID=A0A5B7FLJ1_PORTR|nr:hypothetical protein [Portunus trituberculatus]